MASHTGNAESIAEELEETLTEANYSVDLQDLTFCSDIDFLKEATCILGVVSTWGEGDPPDDATPFFDALKSADSLALPSTPFSVLGLGDTSYEQFCECGKELERQLQRHGGEAFLPRVDCDTWYEEEVETWTRDLLRVLPELSGEAKVTEVNA